ncbi:hypothetical protein CIT25_26835 [Mesorhizobium mediterraneum]|uniref:IS110 family transposase n=1 Tax=Mesorhizobium mediterraneum TaxID=43617 RepID=A0AB36R3H1_9HYPH|nr:hypothetical protein CIT25_26835 [Mesorhizobium mediterraneum]
MEIALTADVAVAQGLVVGRLVEESAIKAVLEDRTDRGGLGRVSKMGNRYLRKLLVVGAHAVLFHRKRSSDTLRNWADRLLETKPFKLVAVATAN